MLNVQSVQAVDYAECAVDELLRGQAVDMDYAECADELDLEGVDMYVPEKLPSEGEHGAAAPGALVVDGVETCYPRHVINLNVVDRAPVAAAPNGNSGAPAVQVQVGEAYDGVLPPPGQKRMSG